MHTLKTDHRRLFITLASTLAAAAGATTSLADVQPNAAMLRFPDVSATHIVFSYANDLWVVPRTGGPASPLASPPGAESLPRFSPDGSTIAFVGNYDGNRDIYTIATAGGVASRVTHHPAGEALSDWAPDGERLVYLTNGFAGLARQTQLWTSDADGGLPTKLPVPYAGFGSVSPDGTWLAYTPHSTDTRTWKRYRGGMATDIWLFNLKDNSSRRITDFDGTDTIPMWVPGGDGRVVYYLSDNGPEHRLNIWAYDIAASQRRQVTSFTDDDIRWPSVGPGPGGAGEIVFQLGAKLMLLDLSSGRSTEVKVTVPGDRPRIRARMVDAAKNLAGASISPSGKRVVVEARGDIWTAPAKEGVTRALTRTDGVAERDPSWSPDNKWIAYFSDETGEYQLWIRPSDARAPEPKEDEKKGDKPDEKPEEKKDAAPAVDQAPAAREPRMLSTLGPGFRYNPTWSPDSKFISFTDENGRLYLADVEKGETKEIDKDPWMNRLDVSWSSDSQWMTYAKADPGNSMSCVWITNARTGEKRQVTASMFNSERPVFDRKGDWLFFTSQRSIESPEYADIESSFAYTNTGVLLMVPLRTDVKSPWLPKSDEEEFKADKPADAKKDEAGKKDEEKKNGADAAVADDGLSGTWTGTAKGEDPQFRQGMPFTLKLTLEKDGKVTGSVTSPQGSGTISGSYDKDSGKASLTMSIEGETGSLSGTFKDGEAKGTWEMGGLDGDWTATRTAKGGDAPAAKGASKDEKKDEKAKEVKIDFEGFEARAIQLPVAPGGFGAMGVADGEKLIFSRRSARGDTKGGIKIYDYKADEKEEKEVVAGGGFQLTADGKKLLVMRGTGLTICDAAAGGGKSQVVNTDAMKKMLDPRAEWKQIFTDAWRLQRDFFYEPTLHHVDWERMRAHYGSMIDDASSKEDVNWIISEMISELNIGHAYLTGPGDVEESPTVGVGLLGADFELDATGAAPAYKITRIYRGGDWDSDAVGPLSQPGANVKEGEYLLAVNGVPIDTSKDPWAALIGTVGKVTALTVNTTPAMDGKQREVLVKPVGSETTLRYRAWIEAKRKYVEEKSGGRMGYIYVPNTGVDGQSDLFRQFFGQRQKDALIIDERWNGGGQIPTRFIELLNRPVTNYWARRDGNDWPWPPDAHFGPKAMLVNGLAGSGGDDFPWLFKYNKLGKVIGTRTWGGLVGISGNPRFVDGGAISVPTFGFYEKDGTWGVEGHGVDPDIEVIDDPALMVNGGDPQLDAAINHLTEELKTKAYTPPQRPASPNRSRMGIPPADH
jgi:tricorn protease